MIDKLISNVYQYFRRANGVRKSILLTMEAMGLNKERVCTALGFDPNDVKE